MNKSNGLKLLIGYISFMLLLCSCSKNGSSNIGDFVCENIDETNIAVGNIRSDYSSSIVFVPDRLNEKNVSTLGFESGLGFGGNGYLVQYVEQNESITGYNLERFYCPNTINNISKGYMKYTKNLKVFYCGEVLNLGTLAGLKMELYVPNDKYEEFYETIYDSYKERLCRANVLYCLNYDTNKVYYVDNYEYNSLIEFIPPNPQRSNYTFDGWYLDEECTNQWIFTINKLPILNSEEGYKETILYAKWK